MRKNKCFIFGLTVSFIIASIPIIYVIYCLINSHIVLNFVILLFALSFVLSLILVLIKKIPGIVKVILPILILAVTLFVFYWLNGVGGHIEFRTFNGESEISEYYEDFDFEQFGSYESISNYKYYSTGIFQQEAYTTILKYDKETFERLKNEINETNTFYNDKNFTTENFDFRIKTSKLYPKELNLIGINDESHEIAYVSFKDYDLDDISSLDGFLYYYCGWDYIAKERD